MKTTLIISAHPSAAGFTHLAVKTIQENKEKSGKPVEVIDLYKDETLPFLAFEKGEEIVGSDAVKSYQDQISCADELYFVFPCWWGDCPSIMRNWMDHVFSFGFAFKTTARRPIGLLKGKNVSVVMTAGNPGFIYALNGSTRAMRRIWKTTRVEYCGMRLKDFLVLGGMESDNRNTDKALARVGKISS